MAKSLRKELTDLSEIAAIVGLNRSNIICVSLYCYGEPQVFVEALELALISRVLEIPRKKIHFSTSADGNLHIDFKARGVAWTSMVIRERVEEFYAVLSAQAPRLTVQPKRLAAQPRRLPFLEATP